MHDYNQVDFPKLKLGGYFRKSSESEDKQALSIESQIAEGKKVLLNYQISGYIETYRESKSAKEQGTRMEFLRMEKDILSGKIDSVLCWKLDRLARNMIEGGKIMDWLAKGVLRCIITHDKVWYPHDNVIVMAVEFGQGKQYVKDLSTNVKRGIRTKANNGVPNGQACIGFKNDKTSEKGNRAWIVDGEKFPLVQKVFKEFLRGVYSANGVAEYARNVLRLTTTTHRTFGGKLVQTSYVHTMLKNPIYAGFFYYQGQRYEFDKNLPRMITEAEHNRIVQMIEVRNVPKTQKHNTIFSGILKGVNGEFIGTDPKFQLICDCGKKFAYRGLENCRHCGSAIKDLNNPKYLHYVYYYNVSKKKRKESYKSIEEQDILNFVKSELVQPLSVNPKFASWAKKNIKHLKDRELTEKTSLKQSVQAIEEGIKKEKEKLRQMLRREVITEEEYREDLAKIEGSVPKLDLVVEDWSEKLNEIVDIGLECAKILESGDEVAVKDVITQSSSNLIWNEKNLEFKRTKWLDAYINGVKDIKSKDEEFEPKNFSRTQLLQGDLEGDVQNLEKYPSLLPDLESNQN